MSRQYAGYFTAPTLGGIPLEKFMPPPPWDRDP